MPAYQHPHPPQAATTPYQHPPQTATTPAYQHLHPPQAATTPYQHPPQTVTTPAYQHPHPPPTAAMSVYQHPRYSQTASRQAYQHLLSSQSSTPTPMPSRFQMELAPQRRWVRVCVFPRNTYARLRYVPLRSPSPEQPREDPLMQDVWSCRTTHQSSEVVRVKYGWEASWDYYEIKFAIPIIPGFGRSNVALIRFQHCPEYVGEVAVVQCTGPRLSVVADMRIEDRKKVEVAVISAIRSAMGLDGTYRGNIIVQFMVSPEALDNLE